MDATLAVENYTLLKTLFSTVGVIGGGAALSSMVSNKVATHILPKPKETRLSEFIPYKKILEDEKTVECEGDILTQFIGIEGLDQTFLEDSLVGQYAEKRKNIYNSMSQNNVILRIFTQRIPHKIEIQTDYSNELCKKIAEKWNAQFTEAYKTRTIIAVSRKGKNIKDLEKLNEITKDLVSQLISFGGKQLTLDPKDSPWKDTTITSFLGRLISPVSLPSPKGLGNSLDDALVGDEVSFMKNGQIRFRVGDKEKYCIAIGIKKFGDSITTAMSNKLSSMPFEMTVYQNIQPVSKGKALTILKQNQMMMGSSSFNKNQINTQYQEYIDLIEGLGESSSTLCIFSETIFVYGETKEKLKEAEEKIRVLLSEEGITPAIEKGATQAAWFNQFPSYERRPRQYRLLSDNVALAATFDATPEGFDKSDWGYGPIALFPTGSNTVYKFQFHSDEHDNLGHGICIARSGAGKTTLMEFLSCMASRKKDLKHFFFDRYQGTYLYTTAMGGKYLGFNSASLPLSIRGGMNPFHCEDNIENRSFLKKWLRSLTNLPPEDEDATKQTSEAVDTAFDLYEPHERSLAAIYTGAFTSGSNTKKALRRWVDPSMYGTIFNAEKDCIDLENNWLTTFDMTKLLSDEILAAPTTAYIMERVRQTIKKSETGGFIFLDETEPLLRDPNFRTIYFMLLQEFRKLHSIVISVFQRPEALKTMGISEVAIQNSSTFYLFQNPIAKEEDYNEFQLTDRELSFVLGRSKVAQQMKRAVLIKKPHSQESVVLDVDLSRISPYIKILSSSSKEIKIASEIQERFPESWVKRYLNEEAP